MNLLDHPEARSMLSYMDQHPGEAEPALVFADWAEEHGFPAHAEMIRLHHSDAAQEGAEPGGNRFNGPLSHNVHISPNYGLKSVSLHLPVEDAVNHTRIGPTFNRIGFFVNLKNEPAWALHSALKEEGAE